MRRADILGVGVDRLGLEAAVDTVLARLRSGERTFVITANPEFVMLARRDPAVRAIAESADLVVADGTGVMVASRLLGDPVPARVPGRVLVDRVVARLGPGQRLFLLGAAPGVAERAAAALRRAHPNAHVAGTHAGSPAPADDEATLARVRDAAPEILLVAFGMPAQERWIARNLARLPSVRLAIGVGGVFDQLAGVARVPPAFVHAVGLEWLWRLLREPRRWRRQRVLPVFAALVLARAIRR